MNNTPPASVASKLARHRAFWSLEATDRPLLGAYAGGYTYPIIYDVAQEGDFLTPAHFARPAAFFDYLARVQSETAQVETDFCVPISVLYGMPWMEACLGLPVQVQAGLFWPHPLLAEDEPLEALNLTLRQDWLDALGACMAAVAAQFGERLPVAPPFLRGPADLLTASLGTARACIEFHDHPDAMLRLAERCADAWRVVATAVSRRIPPFHGGYVNNARYLWSPGPCAYTSEDSTTFLSPATFRRCLLPADQRIAAAFPYGFMHRHSVSRHNIPDLLALPAGWAIEVTLDPTGPDSEALIPLFRQLQAARRPLILFGVRDAGELRALTAALSPRGLCLIVQTDTPAQAAQIFEETQGV